ncbi:MAG: anti-sigma factor family protein [Acidobacteriota bacterium]
MEHQHSGCNCKEIYAMLSEYLDRELSDETCQEIEAHLADCPPCIEFLKSLKRTVGLCKCCEPKEPPPPLTEEVRLKMLSAYQIYLAGKKRG